MVNSLMMISGRIKCRKIDYQKRFPVVQINSMYQVASVCRGSGWNENLASFLVDWERVEKLSTKIRLYFLKFS